MRVEGAAVAIPQDMMFVRLNFDLASGGQPLEHAAVGFHGHRFHRTGNPTDWPANIQEVATKVRDKWIGNMSGYKSRLCTTVSAANVEAYHLYPTGKVQDKGMATFDGANAWAGSASQSTPYQCALVLSMYAYTPGTFVPNSKYLRGRSFWPPPSPQLLDTDGRLTVSAQSEMLQIFGGFFNDVQGMTIGGGSGVQEPDYFDLAVLSKTSQNFYPVTQLGVGRVVDTQRRRRRSLLEARTWTPVDR